jgi:hypothetical protein
MSGSRTELLALVVAATLTAATPTLAADWALAGETKSGNRVFVDRASLRPLDPDIRRADFRVVYREPFKATSGAITSMVATAQFNCRNRTTAGEALALYRDEARNDALSRTRPKSVVFDREPEGSHGAIALDFVCGRR